MTQPELKLKATNWKDAMRESRMYGYNRKSRIARLKKEGFKKTPYKPDMTGKRMKYRHSGGKNQIKK